MTDIVERLRQYGHSMNIVPFHFRICDEAADEIERLRKVNTKLQRDLSDRINDIFEHDAEVERLRGVVEFLDALKGTMRSDALEEAAKVVEADKGWRDVNQRIAAAIRALKGEVANEERLEHR